MPTKTSFSFVIVNYFQFRSRIHMHRELKPVTDEQVFYDKFSYDKFYLPSERVYMRNIFYMTSFHMTSFTLLV